MRWFGDLILLVVQWLLILWGVALIFLSLVEFNFQADLQQGLSVSGLESALYTPPIHQRLVQGVTIGLVAMGLSVALYYLRRLNRSRRL